MKKIDDDKICSNCRWSLRKRLSNKNDPSNYYCQWHSVPKIVDPISGGVTYIWKNQTKREFPFELCIMHNKRADCNQFSKKISVTDSIKNVGERLLTFLLQNRESTP